MATRNRVQHRWHGDSPSPGPNFLSTEYVPSAATTQKVEDLKLFRTKVEVVSNSARWCENSKSCQPSTLKEELSSITDLSDVIRFVSNSDELDWTGLSAKSVGAYSLISELWEKLNDYVLANSKVEESMEALKQFDVNPQKEAVKESISTVLLSTLVIRVGIVVFILLLVQILSGLHRYNIRLSVHNDAQANALYLASLELMYPSLAELNKGVLTLSQDFGSASADFGKGPSTLPSDLLKAISGLGSKRKG